MFLSEPLIVNKKKEIYFLLLLYNTAMQIIDEIQVISVQLPT